MCSVTLALRSDAPYVAQEIRALKPEAQLLITDWLHDHCRTSLEEMLNSNKSFVSEPAGRDLEMITDTLIRTDNTQAKIHLLYIDVLIAKGECWLHSLNFF